MTIPLRIFASFVLAFTLFSVTPRHVDAAFGISPPFIHATHMVRGARYAQTIYLVQDQPNEDLPIKADLQINEKLRPWISITQGFDFVIPKGVRQFPVEIVIQVPQDADLSVYSGNISFTSKPSQTGQVTVALGAQVAINISVGTEIYRSFRVPVVRLLDIEEGWNPLVYVKFANEGNVPESFTGASYELLDQFGSVRLAFVQKTKDFDETPAFTTKEYTVEFPVDFHLGLGQYWGSVAFYQNDTLVASQKTVFNVLKEGSLSGPGARLLRFLKNNLILVVLAAVLIVALLAFFAGYLLRRRRRRRSAVPVPHR